MVPLKPGRLHTTGGMRDWPAALIDSLGLLVALIGVSLIVVVASGIV